jgi:putative peptide zinc metalloprotease protein
MAIDPENTATGWFELPPLKLQRLETALTEPRFMVTLIGQGKRFMIAPKLADILVQLQQKKSPEESAQNLSLLWQQEVTPDALRQIIQQQVLPRGMAYRAGQVPAIKIANAELLRQHRKPLYERLVTGIFRWRLMPARLVGRISSPLTIFYSLFSVILATLLIVATRWSLYSNVDGHFVRQLLLEFTPTEYLLSLGLLIVVILIHEFGHASAQIRFGLPPGMIGFQLYHYIPAFYANVDASWRLKPSQRMVVDIGGIYFQSIAGSVLFLIYLKTQSLPVLSAVLASDVLSVVALNPFLRFDGYWLVADALAVPNLNSLSKKLWAQIVSRVRGREVPSSQVAPLSRMRKMLVLLYGLLRTAFWVLLLTFLILKAPAFILSAGKMMFRLFLLELEGLRTGNIPLIAASLIRFGLSALMALALGALLGSLILKFAKWLWSSFGKASPPQAGSPLNSLGQAS